MTLIFLRLPVPVKLDPLTPQAGLTGDPLAIQKRLSVELKLNSSSVLKRSDLFGFMVYKSRREGLLRFELQVELVRA